MVHALCFYGVMGGIVFRNNEGGKINRSLIYPFIKKHILDCNDIVVYIHCWTEDGSELDKLYEPRRSLYEKNTVLHSNEHDNTKNSWLSMQKVISLIDIEVENVILIRHDMLLLTDILLDTYYDDNFYLLGFNDRQATLDFFPDFYYISSYNNMKKFSKIYYSSYTPCYHRSVGYYIRDNVTKNIIYRGALYHDAQILRKIYTIFSKTKTTIEDITRIYGLTREDIEMFKEVCEN